MRVTVYVIQDTYCGSTSAGSVWLSRESAERFLLEQGLQKRWDRYYRDGDVYSSWKIDEAELVLEPGDFPNIECKDED